MSKENRKYDLEERLIDFAVQIIRTVELLPMINASDELISIFVTSIRTSKQKAKKTS
ncbi:MAG: hypothetical protein JSV83_13515 [Desulfobacterales bacterium]|nr:MAG: hypothetical protein JSV83_13515 [Desulfobacterales bacterium]